MGLTRFCIFCRQNVEAWLPWRNGNAEFSPFAQRVDVIGSNLDRVFCPNCGCHDRERHLRLYMERLDLFAGLRSATVLHMGPEGNFIPMIQALGTARYVLGDLHPANETIQKINLENLPLDEETFDVAIANHVLEHVDNYQQALAEVFRVLKPGGRFICQTPFAARLSTTFEDRAIQDDADRMFFYAHENHVRLFGADIADRFIAAGFGGRLRSHCELLPDFDAEAFGVNEHEPFFDFSKNLG